MPLRVVISKQRVSNLLLIVGQRGVKGAKRRCQLLHIVRVQLGQLGVGLHGVVCVLRRQLVCAIAEGLIGLGRIVAHRLRKSVPLWRLLARDLHLRVQVVDSFLHKICVLLCMANGADAAEEGAAVASLAAVDCAHAEVVKASASKAGATAIRMDGFMLGGLN